MKNQNKRFLPYILMGCIFLSHPAPSQQTYSAVPVIRANASRGGYAIGGEWRNSWRVNPRIARDTITVRCYGTGESFIFKTDLDSIKFNISPGETRLFEVNLGDTARALTVVHAISISQPITHAALQDKQDSIRFWYGYAPGNYAEQLETLFPTQQLIKPNSDLANIAALLEWTHNQWQHNGGNSPTKPDPVSILTEAKAGGQFPCFAYSIVLAGKLNAAGYKSRVLYLKAKNVETDPRAPGHVVAETWVPSLKKWIMLDGQFNAMPMLDGVPLNAVEFRQAIVERKNQEIGFYNTVNYNGVPYTNRKYFEFIYPVLYYFDFAFDSRMDNRKPEPVKGKNNLMLVPLGAAQPTRFGSIDVKINYCIYTTDAKLFYQAPVSR